MASPKSTERQAKTAWYRSKISVVSVSIVAAALVGYAVLYALGYAVISSPCDIYCGSLAVWYGFLILIPVTFVLWLAGLIVAAIAVGVSRARSWLAWVALGLSVVIPAFFLIGNTNIGLSDFFS